MKKWLTKTLMFLFITLNSFNSLCQNVIVRNDVFFEFILPRDVTETSKKIGIKDAWPDYEYFYFRKAKDLKIKSITTYQIMGDKRQLSYEINFDKNGYVTSENNIQSPYKYEYTDHFNTVKAYSPFNDSIWRLYHIYYFGNEKLLDSSIDLLKSGFGDTTKIYFHYSPSRTLDSSYLVKGKKKVMLFNVKGAIKGMIDKEIDTFGYTPLYEECYNRTARQIINKANKKLSKPINIEINNGTYDTVKFLQEASWTYYFIFGSKKRYGDSYSYYLSENKKKLSIQFTKLLDMYDNKSYEYNNIHTVTKIIHKNKKYVEVCDSMFNMFNRKYRSLYKAKFNENNLIDKFYIHQIDTNNMIATKQQFTNQIKYYD